MKKGRREHCEAAATVMNVPPGFEPPADTPEARAEQIKRLLAEAREEPDSPPILPDDVGSVAAGRAAADAVSDLVELARAEARAEVRRQRAVDGQAKAAAAYERMRCPTGQCRYCGLEACRPQKIRIPGRGLRFETIAGWHLDDRGGYRCAHCEIDLFMRVGMTDDDRKVEIMLELLGRQHSIPLLAVANTSAFGGIPLWFAEHDDVTPAHTKEDRFRHVDVNALRAAFDAVVDGYHGPNDVPEPPPEPLLAEPCPACGVQRWIIEPVYAESFGRRNVRACAGCGWRYDNPDAWHLDRSAYPDERKEIVREGRASQADKACARLLGRPTAEPIVGPDPNAGLAEEAKFKWAWQAGVSKPCDRPFGYVDLDRLRRNLARAERKAACG